MPTANKYISALTVASGTVSMDTVIFVLDMSWICGTTLSSNDVEIAVANNGFEKPIGNVHVFKLPFRPQFSEKYFPPCLYANSDVHTIPAVFSETCRCYFPEVSVMVTPATAINLS